ncbi:MAG: cellulase family glycosylhydrolase, partial [Bacteroidota bacterium]
LFDFFLGYRVDTWTLSDQHLRQVVNGVKDHPALFAWDLKNEPDLDFEQSGELEVVEWLRFIAQRLKTYDAEHLITIGWSQPEYASKLSDLMDFLSFHFYREPAVLTEFLAEPSNADKPLFVGEMGIHSFNGWWFPFRKSQADQQEYVASLLEVIKEHEISYGFWTLYDFRQVPSNVAGKLPWRKNPQKHFGLIDTKGREKEVYNTILDYNCREK